VRLKAIIPMAALMIASSISARSVLNLIWTFNNESSTQMQPIQIYPEYAMILQYDVRPGTHERYYRYVTTEFLPALQKRKIYMQNAWLVVHGDYPERHVEFITEQLEILRKLFDDPEWDQLESKLKTFADNYSCRIVKYRSNFKL
jgi:hypothetical protein